MFGALSQQGTKINQNFFILYRNRDIEDEFAIIGVGQEDLTKKEYEKKIISSIQYLNPTENEKRRFLKKFYYQKITANSLNGYLTLNLNAQIIENELDLNGDRIYLMANHSKESFKIIQQIKKYGALSENGFNRFVVKRDAEDIITLFYGQQVDIKQSQNKFKAMSFSDYKNNHIQVVYAKNF